MVKTVNDQIYISNQHVQFDSIIKIIILNSFNLFPSKPSYLNTPSTLPAYII